MTSTLIIEKPELKRKVQETVVKSFWLSLGELRLNGSFYAQEVSKATRLLEESGYEILATGEHFSKDVYYLGRQKRFFADANVGEPYLMPSELLDFPFTPSKHVYAKKLKKSHEWYVKDGCILLTRSGKLAQITIATKSLEKYIVSDDVIRFVPKDEVYGGFIYSYLATWIGKALLTKNQYGVAIDHIEPRHVKKVKVPFLPKEIQKVIHGNILKVFNLREKARGLLDKSQIELLRELDLPEFEVPTRKKQFSVKSSNLDLRFDASFHNPVVELVRQKLQDCRYKPERLENSIDRPFFPNRFKRVYVEKEYGIPFLSGSQIGQVKPYDLKYLSRKVTAKLENCLVHKGWILVTRSGTVGKVALVPTQWDGWAVSEHAMRIIPIQQKIHTGFLTAFLQSEYGHQQIVSKIYGGVVDELAEDDLLNILVPIPNRDVQERIGKLVVEAYELKEYANTIEEETIKTLENMLEKHKKIEVNEEYLKEINTYADSFELIANEEFRESRDESALEKTISLEEFKKEHEL